MAIINCITRSGVIIMSSSNGLMELGHNWILQESTYIILTINFWSR